MKSATVDATSSTKLRLKTDALAARGLEYIMLEREWISRDWMYAIVWS